MSDDNGSNGHLVPAPNGKRGPGRPTKRTPELVKNLTDALQAGAPVIVACEYAGIHPGTFYDWQAIDDDFASQVARARARPIVRDLTIIAAAAPTDWRAAEAHLRLVRPDLFGRSVVEHEVQGTAKLIIERVDRWSSSGEGVIDAEPRRIEE